MAAVRVVAAADEDAFGDGGGALVGRVIGRLGAVGGVESAEQPVAARSPPRTRAEATARAARGGVMLQVITGFLEVTSGPGRMGYGVRGPWTGRAAAGRP
ncbi:hypothetical protein TUSST3_25600 [Streptomyces sp. TUS-ST3]|jgi:hypothetical protein|nr:hypothetical protein TUSST3_25600 [Streptomyces sp. TUS-ST3]